MYTDNLYRRAYQNSQVAYPVGQAQDCYNINSIYRESLEDGIIVANHRVVKNFVYGERNPNLNYKENRKFSEELFEGTYKECVKFIEDIILKEGEWRPISKEQPFEKHLVFTV